jgi:hypothetical protein
VFLPKKKFPEFWEICTFFHKTYAKIVANFPEKNFLSIDRLGGRGRVFFSEMFFMEIPLPDL